MSAVDVLAVMDTQIACLCIETPEDQAHFDAMVGVRAAVAELIEAATNYQQAMDGTRDLAYRCEMGRLLEVALARVGGAA